ncbi:MFS transporter, partial [Paraburkholderia sp. C35]|uniref:MFS transporter n=1 Tax=Paraburkholderia sp. C35 TaxID=2126993 RepID=UPI000D697102
MMDVQNPSTEAGAVAVGGRPAHSTAPADRQLDQIYSRVRLRLMPLLLIAQVLAYLDRVNIGTAKLQMAVDLHFSNAVYGLGAGIFFVGYFIAEVPSNMLLHRLGARAWIARIMVSWGILSAATMFIHSTQAFYVQRFLLGLAEAGFFPGVVLYLTYWFPAHRRGSMTTLFMSATAVSGIVGGPLSGWIMVAFNGLHGLEGWRWMFLLEAGPAIALGVVIFFRLPDRPRDVQWLGAEDKALLQRDIDTYVPSQGSTRGNAALRAVLNATTLFFSAVYFLLLAGLYGVSFWLPSLIRQTGVHDTLTISWL